MVWLSKIIVLFLLYGSLLSSVVAMEVSFTPNPDDAATAGPLPLSQRQRDQLTQLATAIQSSPDPQATLNQVAQANNLTPDELMGMLQRNMQDKMSTTSQRRLVSSWPQAILQLLTTLTLILQRWASQHPKAFGLSATALLLLLYIRWNVPRNGLVISTHSSLWSKGHSTLWNPPRPYIMRQLDSLHGRHPSIQSLDDELMSTLSDDEDGVTWHTLPKKSKLSQLVTATLILDDDEVPEVLFETARDVVLARRWTEFSNTQFIVNDDNDLAILVIPKAGDYKGYGLQPMKLLQTLDTDSTVSVSYVTIKGGVLDCQLNVRITRNDNIVVLQLSLAIPKRNARKLSRHAGTTLLDSILMSMATSISTQVKQRTIRTARSKQFSQHARMLATERQEGKLLKSIQMEEMAADRRRRRRNPNAGRYRPTGQKMPTSTSPGRGI